MAAQLMLVVDNAPYVPGRAKRENLHLRLVGGTMFNAAARDTRAGGLTADPEVRALFNRMGYAADDPALTALFAPRPDLLQKLHKMPDPWA